MLGFICSIAYQMKKKKTNEIISNGLTHLPRFSEFVTSISVQCIWWSNYRCSASLICISILSGSKKKARQQKLGSSYFRAAGFQSIAAEHIYFSSMYITRDQIFAARLVDFGSVYFKPTVEQSAADRHLHIN